MCVWLPEFPILWRKGDLEDKILVFECEWNLSTVYHQSLLSSHCRPTLQSSALFMSVNIRPLILLSSPVIQNGLKSQLPTELLQQRTIRLLLPRHAVPSSWAGPPCSQVWLFQWPFSHQSRDTEVSRLRLLTDRECLERSSLSVCPSVDKECSFFKEQQSGDQIKVGSIRT